MNERYIQPFGNPGLNSFTAVTLKTEGKTAAKFVFNETDIPGETSYLYLLDDNSALVDFGVAYFAADINRRTALDVYDKSENSFLQLATGLTYRFVDSYRLFKAGFSVVDYDAESSFIPGLGEYSQLYCLVPDEETFIGGVMNRGTYDKPVLKFEIYRRPYPGFKRDWNIEFEGPVLRPPVTETYAVVAQDNAVVLVDFEGNKKTIVSDEFEALTVSAGPDGLLYLVVRTEDGTKLRVYDFEGLLQWESFCDIEEFVQPPVVNADGLVYLAGDRRVAAYREGVEQWTFPTLTGTARATAFADNRLVVTDGGRIVCLDENGEELWKYVDKDGDVFVTPPVADSRGRILAASDRKILRLE